MTARKIAPASGSCDQRDGNIWIAHLVGGLAGSDAVGEQRPAVGEKIGPEDDGGPGGVRHIPAQRAAESGEAKMPGRCFLGDADAGQGAQKAIERVGIGLAGGGQGIEAALFVSEGIGHAEARRRTQDAAAGIGHGHFYKSRIRCDIANAGAGLSHE